MAANLFLAFSSDLSTSVKKSCLIMMRTPDVIFSMTLLASALYHRPVQQVCAYIKQVCAIYH